MLDIPDHPDIQRMERDGALFPELPDPTCPICGKECETIYQDETGDVIGCDCCVKTLNAWNWWLKENEGAEE